jgi:hypothetical protein
MAIISPANLGQGTLTAAAVAYATASGASKVIIKQATFTNTDTVARTITVYRVPSGGAAAAGNLIIQAQSLSAGQSYDPPSLKNMVLNPGETLQALASTAAVVNVFVSGLTA